MPTSPSCHSPVHICNSKQSSGGTYGKITAFPWPYCRCPVGRYTGEHSTPVSKETPEDPTLPSWKQRTKLRNGFALHQLYSSSIRAT